MGGDEDTRRLLLLPDFQEPEKGGGASVSREARNTSSSFLKPSRLVSPTAPPTLKTFRHWRRGHGGMYIPKHTHGRTLNLSANDSHAAMHALGIYVPLLLLSVPRGQLSRPPPKRKNLAELETAFVHLFSTFCLGARVSFVPRSQPLSFFPPATASSRNLLRPRKEEMPR